MALADGFIFQVSPDGRLIDTAETTSTLRSFTGDDDARNGPLPDRLFLFAAPQSHGDDAPLTPVQTNRLQEVVRQNASAGNAGLRNWSDFASLLVSTDDEGDLFERMQEWTAEGPARPTWMDEVHPREAYKALTLMRLYELRSWEAIKETGDCGCDVRFPPWDAASAEYEERFATSTQAEHTQARLAIRDEQNQIARDVQDICEAQGNW